MASKTGRPDPPSTWPALVARIMEIGSESWVKHTGVPSCVTTSSMMKVRRLGAGLCGRQGLGERGQRVAGAGEPGSDRRPVPVSLAWSNGNTYG